MEEVTARRLIRINLGNYEHVEIERTITGIPGTTPGNVIDETLDGLMAADIERATQATQYDPKDNDTSVYEWNRIMGGQ